MATTPGFPLVTIPAFSTPAFSSSRVAVGGTVTTVTLESTAASAQSNAPFTFGHAFKQGDMAPGDFLTGRTSGQPDVPLQFNVKATHFDGSVRHAIISGILPYLAAGSSRVLSLVRVASNPVGASAEGSGALVNAGFTASLALVIAGTTYTASPTAALAAGMAPASVWIGGAVATEWSMMLPLLDGGGNPHPLLSAQFNIRHYPGAASAKVDITIENTKAYAATTDVAYDATLTVGGAVAYAYTGVTHYVATRFYRSVWWGAKPALHVKHDRAYLTATRQVPNYDLSVVMDEATLNGYVTQMTNPAKFGPMGAGPYAPYMAGTGGRQDIGLQPAWAAATVISMDKRAKDMALAGAACGGSWACHRRDTSAGPGNSYPLSVVNFPYATIVGRESDAWNPSTGLNEYIPARPNTNPNVEDDAHTPNFSYLAYLLTGDLFYMEEIMFYSTWIEYFENCSYRQTYKGVLDTVPLGQVRAQAWALRALAEAAAVTPDAHPLKSHFLYWTNNTLASHNARFTDNPAANKLGVNDTFKPYSSALYGAHTAIALWQDDHFTSAVGHAAELGFTEAARLLKWKAKFQIGRLIDPNWCFQDAALYQVTICTAEGGPTFDTFAQVKAGTVGTTMDGRGTFDAATVAAPCNSQQRLDAMNAVRYMPSDPFKLGEITGYAYGTEGYPANLQPALAMAVDSGYTDGDLAWMQFDSRTVKPNYGLAPQFAIIPRTGATKTMTAPPDIYTVASGQPIYGGRAAPAAPATVRKLGAITITDTGNASPADPYYASIVKGMPLKMELHGSNGTWSNGRFYTTTVDGDMALPGNTEFKFGAVVTYVAGKYGIELRPVDVWPGSGGTQESSHLGFVMLDGTLHIPSEHRYDALLDWCDDPANPEMTVFDLRRRVLSGGSMGGWGTISFGVKRYDKFAALYADRPRFRYGLIPGKYNLPVWGVGRSDIATASMPAIFAGDGGGNSATYLDFIAYVSNPANKVRPILWCVGRADTFVNFQDHIDMVDAMRATGRAFAFAWNTGDHTAGSIMGQLTASYPVGTYSRDKGYPLFTEHSLDKDPRVDQVGMINGNLSFRNVVENATGWSCEVTNIAAACTVKVTPISDAYKGDRTPKTVPIPAANTWVLVQFGA